MPKAETPQKRKRQPTGPRAPRSSKKGDELGKDKTQQSLLKYFTPSPIKWESSNFNNNRSANHVRKTLFPNQGVNMSDSDAVCISDDDELTQKSIESYHPKSKKPVNFLSRKHAKKRQISQESVPASASSNGDITTTPMNETLSSPAVNPNKKSLAVVSGVVKSTALRANGAGKLQNGAKAPKADNSRKRKSTGGLDTPRKIVARDGGISRSGNGVTKDLDDTILVLGSSEEITSSSPPRISTVSEPSSDISKELDSDDDDSSNIFIRTSLDLKRKAPPFKSVGAKKPWTLGGDGSPAKRTLSFLDTQSGIGNGENQPTQVQAPALPLTGNETSQTFDLHSEPGPPADVIELSSESIPVSSLVPKVSTLDDQLLSGEDWSQPMEQEIFHSPVKTLPNPDRNMEQNFLSTTCLAGNTSSPSSSKVSLSISRTPQKVKTPLSQSIKSSLPNQDIESPLPSQSTESPLEDTRLLPPNGQSFSPSKRTPSKLLKSPSKSPKKGSPSKSNSPKKYNLAAMSGNVLLEHSINECKRYAQMAFKMNATNRRVADDYLVLDLPEKILLHHLLIRKWSWIREVDMKYDKVVHQKASSLTALETKGFLESMSTSEDLKVILDELKLPELVELCKLQNLDKKGAKKDLVDRLNKFATRQGGLGFTAKNLKSVMKDRAVKSLGRCWKVAEGPRIALQQIFEASMCPIFLEGQFYTFQERLRGMELLMNEVKFNGRKLVPFSLSEEQLFTTPTQFDEYVSSVIIKYDILAASVKRDHAEGARLAVEVLQNLKIYLGSTALPEFLQRTPRHLWRYTACANYTSALDKGIEFLKRSKNYKTALEACDVLLQQDIFRRHARGHWYAEKILLMDKHLKSSQEQIFVVLLNGLEEELTAIGRLELSKKAEGILHKKKNGLSPDQKQQIQTLIRVPKLNHPIREIKATEAPNVSTGKRQTFVELTAEGEQVYSNVEQTAQNEYMGEFPEGLHDEGAFLKNVILAAFWPVIYMPMEKVFLSRYQHCPLDWGTTAFYKARHGVIKDHMAKLRSGGLDGIMVSITETVTAYSSFHSIVNWSYISFDMLPTIKKLLACLTVDKFLVLAEYLLENYRERRSGWPDLTLWNFCTRQFLLVEVKSPNDELSFKQIVWLEKFAEMGIPVEECRVNPTNKGKKRQARALANAQTAEKC